MGDHTLFIATGVAICCAVVGWFFINRKPTKQEAAPEVGRIPTSPNFISHSFQHTFY